MAGSPHNAAALVDELPAVVGILDQMGVEIRGTMACCPFHDDRSPSLSIFAGGTRWKCHVCHIGGTAADLYARWKGITRPEAATALYESYVDIEAAERAVQAALQRFLENEGKHRASTAACRSLWDLTGTKGRYVKAGRLMPFDAVQAILRRSDEVYEDAEDGEWGAPTRCYPELIDCLDDLPEAPEFERIWAQPK